MHLTTSEDVRPIQSKHQVTGTPAARAAPSITSPLDVVRGLVENALDAEAGHIEVTLTNSGWDAVEVDDNGIGIALDSLPNCVLAGFTTKGIGRKRYDWKHQRGGNGDFLSAVAQRFRLSITSRVSGEDAWRFEFDGNTNQHSVRPGLRKSGTSVCIEGLSQTRFGIIQTPTISETMVKDIENLVRQFAIFNPNVRFTLREAPAKTLLETGEKPSSIAQRYSELSDQSLFDGAKSVATLFCVAGDTWKAEGTISMLPPGVHEHHDRALCEFNGLISHNPSISRVLGNTWKSTFAAEGRNFCYGLKFTSEKPAILSRTKQSETDRVEPAHAEEFYCELQKALISHLAPAAPQKPKERPQAISQEPTEVYDRSSQYGSAIGQYDKKFILSQTRSGLLIIDQHAVHEKMLFLQLTNRQSRLGMMIESRSLVFPIEVSQDTRGREWFLNSKAELAEVGIQLEYGDGKTYLVQGPCIEGISVSLGPIFQKLERSNFQMSAKDIIAEIAWDYAEKSINAAKRDCEQLSLDQMNAFLRIMEANPEAATSRNGSSSIKKIRHMEILKFFGKTS